MIDYDRGVVQIGNPIRFQQAVSHAAAGQMLRIAFIGGSITQGSLASMPETCYAYRVYRWFADQFPSTLYCNAGIGGTDSQFGAARVQEDVLSWHADIVFVEFSVNDTATDHYLETYEGLIRQLLRAGAAVILVHNAFYDTGASAEEVHLAIGRHYQLPSVSIRPSICEAVFRGTLAVREITPDDLHPNDNGHLLLANQIICLLEKLRNPESFVPASIPEPLTLNHYEHCVRYQNHNCQPVCNGFLPDMEPQTHITQMFRRGFFANNTGDSIHFCVESTCLAVQYRKSVRHPTPIALAIIDGDEQNALILDGSFSESWGDCLYLQTILNHGPLKSRTVEIRIIQSSAQDVVPFYLVSLIASRPEE